MYQTKNIRILYRHKIFLYNMNFIKLSYMNQKWAEHYPDIIKLMNGLKWAKYYTVLFKFELNTCWQNAFILIILYEPKMSGTLSRHLKKLWMGLNERNTRQTYFHWMCSILIRKLVYRVKMIMNSPKLSGIHFFKFQYNTCWQQQII